MRTVSKAKLAKELRNYQLRVRYHSDPDFKKKCIDAAAKYRNAHKVELSEKLSRKKQKARERAASHANFLESERLRGITLQTLMYPEYQIERPGRKKVREKWPLDDEAARWIRKHEAANAKPPAPTREQDRSA